MRFSKIIVRQGFTLIELMMVIAIVGLLASVVLSSTQDARREARNAQRVTTAKQLQNAVELFKSANGSYPCNKNNGVICTVGGLHSISFNDGTPRTSSGSTSTRQTAFRTDLARFIPETNDSVLSGTDPDLTGYGNNGSILYYPAAGYQSYRIDVYGEPSSSPICTLTNNKTDC